MNGRIEITVDTGNHFKLYCHDEKYPHHIHEKWIYLGLYHYNGTTSHIAAPVMYVGGYEVLALDRQTRFHSTEQFNWTTEQTNV